MGVLGWIQLAFKDRVLHALAPVRTGLGNAAESALASVVTGFYIVGDQNMHGSPPDKGGVDTQLASKHTAEEPGLEVDHQADADSFVKVGVEDLLLLSFLVGREYGAPSGGSQADSAAFQKLEVSSVDLAAVDETEDEAVAKEAAEFLHEIERERGATGAVSVEKADGWVEAAGFACAPGIVGKHGVEKTEQTVEGIPGRAAGAFGHAEGITVGRVEGDETVDDTEVGVGGFAFMTTKGIKSRGVEGGWGTKGHAGAGSGKRVLRITVIAGGAEESSATVGDLRGDHGPSDGQAAGFIVGRAVLVAAEQNIARGKAADAGDKTPGAGTEADCDALFCAKAEEGGRSVGAAKADDAAEGVDGNAKFDFSVDGDTDGTAVLVKPSTIGLDKEGIEVVFHRRKGIRAGSIQGGLEG